MDERLEVRVGIGSLEAPMTREQARRWGERNMPPDLKAAGFGVEVFRSDREINDSDFFRVSFGKTA